MSVLLGQPDLGFLTRVPVTAKNTVLIVYQHLATSLMIINWYFYTFRLLRDLGSRIFRLHYSHYTINFYLLDPLYCITNHITFALVQNVARTFNYLSRPSTLILRQQP